MSDFDFDSEAHITWRKPTKKVSAKPKVVSMDEPPETIPVWTYYDIEGKKSKNKDKEKIVAKMLVNGDFKRFEILGDGRKPADLHAVNFDRDKIDKFNPNTGVNFYEFLKVSEEVFDNYIKYVKTKKRNFYDAVSHGMTQ